MLPLLQLAATLNRVGLPSAHGPWSRAIGDRYLLGPPPVGPDHHNRCGAVPPKLSVPGLRPLAALIPSISLTIVASRMIERKR